MHDMSKIETTNDTAETVEVENETTETETVHADHSTIGDLKAVAEYLDGIDRGDVWWPRAMFRTGEDTLDFNVSTWDMPGGAWRLEGEEKAEAVLVVIRAIVKQLGGTWAKNDPADGYFNDAYYILESKTAVVNGHIKVRIMTDRNAVCERVQVGTKTKTVPAVEAQPERTVEEPVFERECRPLFSRQQSESFDTVIS